MTCLFNRVGVACATTGTGTATLGAALGAVAPNLAGYQTPAGAGVPDQAVIVYLILDAVNAWELGYGVYSASGGTITRSNIIGSSNSNLALNLSGNEQVFFVQDATATIGARVALHAYSGGL